IAAANWATPPKNAAKGNRYCGEVLVPYQPARCAATMNVAPAKPKSPRIDGGAIGCSTTRLRSSHATWLSGERAGAVWFDSYAAVLMEPPRSGLTGSVAD